ncbi:MAG TPA: DVUA0089 family protein, partial [Pirellulales bacterium]|nr:DVUA0089 family protein [Pirellulales bacterium]
MSLVIRHPSFPRSVWERPCGRSAAYVLAPSLLVCLLAAPARAQSSYPMLMSLKPLAAQIGQTTEHELTARYNLYGAYQVFVSGTGVTAEVVDAGVKPGEPPPEKKPELAKIKLRFIVAADAVPGVRSFRAATPQGASTVGQVVLVRDPIVFEADNNDVQAAAQSVTLPATLCGAIEKAEDVDFFKFTVAENTAWTFHVQSSRCEDKIHDLQVHSDPILLLRNASGTVLATNDNYFYGDPLLVHGFTAAGEYFLEIRDVRYQGNGDWQYSIEANDRPFVTNVFPSRVAPGAATRVQLIGFNLPADPTCLITLPPDVPEGMQWINLPLGAVAANAAPVVVSRLPETTETDADNDLPAQAQPVGVPAGVSGRIAREGDIDCFVFEAKKDQKLSFEVVARRHQSALDPVVRILNADGAALAEIDDMNNGRHIYQDAFQENW